MSLQLVRGDVFEVQIDAQSVRFFQYIADDVTQLGSQVVRVFRERVAAGNQPDVDGIVRGSVDFYAHVFLRNGLKQRLWRKIGTSEPPSAIDVLFRDSEDYGHPEVLVSKRWYVWRVNQPFEMVGELVPAYQKAEVGVIVPPDSLVYRMQNGNYDFVYPKF